MKRFIYHSSLILLGAIFLLSSQKKKDLLLGNWRNKKYGVEVTIFKKDSIYYGNVKDAGSKRGNEKLKKGPMQILRDFKKTSDSTYCCGSIYIPKTGTRIYSEIKITSPNTLIVTGNLLGIKTSSHWFRTR